MDEIRTFMSAREAPFRLKGLRAIFVSKEDEEEEQVPGVPSAKRNVACACSCGIMPANRGESCARTARPYNLGVRLIHLSMPTRFVVIACRMKVATLQRRIAIGQARRSRWKTA